MTAPAPQLDEARRCMAMRRWSEAERLFREIAAQDSAHAESWHSLGVIALETGRPDAAAPLFERALKHHDAPQSHATLALALERLGRLQDAAASYRRAIDLRPDYADAHGNLGTVYGRLGDLAAAEESFLRALSLNPGNPSAQYNIGFACEQQGKMDEALGHYRKALLLRPNAPEVLNSLGMVLFALKQVDEALEVLGQAVARAPTYADAWNNLGAALLAAHRPADALTAYDRVLAFAPGHGPAWLNRGEALSRLSRGPEALESYIQCQKLTPDFAQAHWAEGTTRLMDGDFSGWEKYEWRWRMRPDLVRPVAAPLWLGAEDLDGKSILVHAEQGFGDTIQFSRYLPLLAAKGARVVFECPPMLRGLMAELDGVELVVQGEALPATDFQCPLLSLPLAFRTTLETLPSYTPYLRVPEAVLAKWRTQIDEALGPKKGLRVGLAWSGRFEKLGERHRSIPPAQLAPLLATGAQLVSLQKDYRPEDWDWLAAHPEVLDVSGELADFADTAAVASLMDVVVSIDTAAAHVAGALNKPAWIMLSYIGDWRWMRARADSPWYPSAKLYRQAEVNDWTGVIARIAADLMAKA